MFILSCMLLWSICFGFRVWLGVRLFLLFFAVVFFHCLVWICFFVVCFVGFFCLMGRCVWCVVLIMCVYFFLSLWV